MSRTTSVTMLRNMNNEELLQYTQSLLDLGELERELASRFQNLLQTAENDGWGEQTQSLALLNNLQLQINALKERFDKHNAGYQSLLNSLNLSQ